MGANNETITVDKGTAESGDYITLKDIEAIETINILKRFGVLDIDLRFSKN